MNFFIGIALLVAGLLLLDWGRVLSAKWDQLPHKGEPVYGEILALGVTTLLGFGAIAVILYLLETGTSANPLALIAGVAAVALSLRGPRRAAWRGLRRMMHPGAGPAAGKRPTKAPS